MKIFIVVAERGEHSAYQDWIVRAHEKEKEAELHCMLAENQIAEIIDEYGEDFELQFGNEEAAKKIQEELTHDEQVIDENCFYLKDIKKTSYFVVECDFWPESKP